MATLVAFMIDLLDTLAYIGGIDVQSVILRHHSSSISFYHQQWINRDIIRELPCYHHSSRFINGGLHTLTLDYRSCTISYLAFLGLVDNAQTYCRVIRTFDGKGFWSVYHSNIQSQVRRSRAKVCKLLSVPWHSLIRWNLSQHIKTSYSIRDIPWIIYGLIPSVCHGFHFTELLLTELSFDDLLAWTSELVTLKRPLD